MNRVYVLHSYRNWFPFARSPENRGLCVGRRLRNSKYFKKDDSIELLKAQKDVMRCNNRKLSIAVYI